MLDHDQLYKGTEDWPKLLEKYHCDAVLVDQNSGLRPLLEVFRDANAGQPVPTLSHWQFVYEDGAFVVLARNATQNLPYRDSRSEPLLDGAHLAFSNKYSSRARRLNASLVSQVTRAGFAVLISRQPLRSTAIWSAAVPFVGIRDPISH